MSTELRDGVGNELGSDCVATAETLFASDLKRRQIIDAVYMDGCHRRILACTGEGPVRPILRIARKEDELAKLVDSTLKDHASGLLVREGERWILVVASAGSRKRVRVPLVGSSGLSTLVAISLEWAGRLNDRGEFVFDPRTPSPGTHYRANLLLGDRTGCSKPLLTTPKAVVDEWGGGSSRSHSNKEILATRWDHLPQENGFPANRQFYLTEDGQQIFYSAAPPVGAHVETRHGCNFTCITYELEDGLTVERRFFMLAAESEVPHAIEAQVVTISNHGRRDRQLALTATGMLGFPHPGALSVDVIYTCVTTRPRVRVIGEKELICIVPEYTAGWGTQDQPFSLMVGYEKDGPARGVQAYTLDYRSFVGNGTLEHPEFLSQLDNAFPQKGPAFYATACQLTIKADSHGSVHLLNGSLSDKEGCELSEEKVGTALDALAEKLDEPAWIEGCLEEVQDDQERYASTVQVQTDSSQLDALLNHYLPFQIRYQTYVSRSFGLTQKGFRQIGFREIQDLFAALPFEVAMGRKEHVWSLIETWVSHVYRFGYANHQFYWHGIEPGRYSDDALWLIQAVGRFIDLTGDSSVLMREVPVADGDGARFVYETLEAIMTYSSEISVGRHGLPLIDHADWNDTLNLDGEQALSGPVKEALYRQQLEEGVIGEGEPLESDISESVMNGFLLEVARRYMERFARMLDNTKDVERWELLGTKLRRQLQVAWKGDFFARAFINRDNEAGVTYIGAQNDGLSGDPDISGTYFLNSFSWSILSDVATEKQIETMLDRVEEYLRTPSGLRISSPARFRAIMPKTGSGDYADGDRENGGVFKHANMMAAVALIEGAKRAKDEALSRRLLNLGWEVLQKAAPFRTLEDPYVLAGNPRLCTQYTNPTTGEHVGPLLSGTAPWMWLAYMSVLGVGFREGSLVLNPVLPQALSEINLSLSAPAGRFEIELRRSQTEEPSVLVDGCSCGRVIPPTDRAVMHKIVVQCPQV